MEQVNLSLGGSFYFEHYRSGKLLAKEMFKNIFVNEGLAYALNSAFAASVGGVPSPFANMYVGLTTSTRAWTGEETASGDGLNAGNTAISILSSETDAYDEVTRPEWTPIALSTYNPLSLELSDSGVEATYTIDAPVTVTGAFLISSSAKDGSNDAAATLLAGSKFTDGSRDLKISDVFKVGYNLTAQTA